MMTQTVPVRVEDETIQALDLLVKLGFYKNRSEAMRDVMKKGLEAWQDAKEFGRLVAAIEKLDKAGKLDFGGLKLERDRF
jgi:Arc/MetJ-type ribon-helix-helix transcriptional regulator